MPQSPSGNEIRKQFIDFFEEKHGHTYVQSSSLVPGNDATLLFTNSGMVQFKDVFLGTDKRDYVRAVNSQKCMRVAGKHNDLEDVGFDDTHHTFFEMLGNWSFGDYYKKEAIAWAWELLTEVWGLNNDDLYVTVFKDEKGEIPTDDEAFEQWKNQPGLTPDHILYYGRKDNFWEMAATGPCGPNSEIHIDRGSKYGELTTLENGQPDLDGPRFLELWNLVFMQYNRIDESTLDPLPATHVDTGMGFERIVSVLQDQSSNYRTDLFWPVIEKIQELAGHSDKQRDEQFTPYRVIADHVRAATFLIADGVIPGNMGRNYITRMVVRRAARFASKLGLNDPFLAKVAKIVIKNYGDAFPELTKNKNIILDSLTREEKQFKQTVDRGVIQLDNLIAETKKNKETVLDGEKSFRLYDTHGLPLEITRDIVQEVGLSVDEAGFKAAMEAHRIASGGGSAMGALGGEDAEAFQKILTELQKEKKLTENGVQYDPYSDLESIGEVLALVYADNEIKFADEGTELDLILPSTNFYMAAGGQVSDTGTIHPVDKSWEFEVTDIRQPAAGIIAHRGKVSKGTIKVGDQTETQVDPVRRQDIIRNHTATHLLHAELHRVLGDYARQAGSLVAPDRLRFDFQHPEAVTQAELAEIEAGVNNRILENHELRIETKALAEARAEGATALFGEKYGETVRTVQIGGEQPFSYELCGGTHVTSTGEIGTFLIISEGSVASGIRRIEAITGREAYQSIQKRNANITKLAALLKTTPDNLLEKTKTLSKELSEAQKTISGLKHSQAADSFSQQIENAPEINGVRVLASILPEADRDTLRELADRFRQKYATGVTVLASVIDDKPAIIAAVTDDLVKQGWHAGDLVKVVSEHVGGSGGGRPNLAQAGGKDASKLESAIALVADWVTKKTQG